MSAVGGAQLAALLFASGAVATLGSVLSGSEGSGITTLYHGSDASSIANIIANGLDPAAASELGGGDVFWATSDKGIATLFAEANPAGGAPAVAEIQVSTSSLQSMIQSGAVAIDRTGAYMIQNWSAFNRAILSIALAE
jgi:hypothetical protein